MMRTNMKKGQENTKVWSWKNLTNLKNYPDFVSNLSKATNLNCLITLIVIDARWLNLLIYVTNATTLKSSAPNARL